MFSGVAQSLFPGRRLPLRIDPTSGVPPYAQLRSQLSVFIAHGRLRPGERLPTVRALAADLGLAPGTVARTYRQLEEAGLVTGQGRRGTFVVDEPANAESLIEREERLSIAAQQYLSRAKRLGVDLESAIGALRSAARLDPADHSSADPTSSR